MRRWKTVYGLILWLGAMLVPGAGAAGQNQETAHPLYLQARSLMEAGIWMEAVYRLEQYLAEAEDANPRAHLEAAELLFKMGLDRQAADHAALLLNQHPADPEARRLLIRIRSRMAIEIDRSDPDHVLHLARIARLLGNTDRAAAYYEEAHKAAGDPAILLEWARTMRWGGRRRRALSLYRTYLLSQPADHEARQELGRLLNEMGRHNEATDALQSAVAKAPHDPGLVLDLARALHWSGQTEAAGQHLEALRERGRADTAALLFLAGIRHEQARYYEAHQIYQALLDHTVPPAEAQFRLHQYERERLLEIDALRAHLATHPNDIEKRKHLIERYIEQQRFADARREIEWLSPLADDDPDLAAWQQQIHRRERNQVEERLLTLRAKRAAQPDNRQRLLTWWIRHNDADYISHWERARLLRRSGQVIEARNVLQHLLERHPDHPAIVAAFLRAAPANKDATP